MKKRLTRSTTDRFVAGVCGGLAEYFGVDSTWIRLAFIVLIPYSFFMPIVVYIACYLLIPEKRNIQRASFRHNVNNPFHRLHSHARSTNSEKKK
ncbi:PspC domain-containing protein [Companilactobacillus mishanensis]|uniref:PspC domain-containing protein n=1 Tax=Companilactobacillus mishanensis TaxID=2486008 RepID=A0A5P0ZFW3_9LACO|nr:PspC domain-containing protein [Companilactobacillus mishanensis]MQS45661.1 PspC domain-containing protein [Companilactobacillus mishanensis]MQS51908.1 PspC domain-containing protein [Companilactobacillus mishanensis]MQS88977.1 PspC domain-containing protein [Companilactobacillus mishanensis]